MAENNQSSTVSLGCGTLILIALIVLIFSKPGHDEVVTEIRRLRTEVQELRRVVDHQTRLIKELQSAEQAPAAENR